MKAARRLLAVWMVAMAVSVGGVHRAEALRRDVNRGFDWDRALGFKP